MKKANIKYTYKIGRKCEYCGEPIADHLHENRKHCLPEVYIDGSVKDCKVKRNNEKGGIKNKETKSILEEWKSVLVRVKKLVALKGNIVTTEDLDFHEISLLKALRNEPEKKSLISYFRGFEISTSLANRKHLITIKL